MQASRLTAIVTAIAALALPAAAVAKGNAPRSMQLEPVPNLPVNACNDSTLPRDFGTNFPTPGDPDGFGFANQTAIGWEGNLYAPFEYLSGSYFARGVPTTYKSGNQTLCGAMYSFGAYTYGLTAGQAPAPGSVHWTMDDGYLPAMTTSFTRNGVSISITDFANQQSIGGNPVELAYTRVSVTNHGSAAVTVPAGPSGPNLVSLNQASDNVAPGQTVRHDFVAAVDTFSTTVSLPSVGAITPSHGSGALPYDAAYRHMADYWNQRLSVAPRLSLPNVPLANTNNLRDPGTSIDNAYKAAFVYTRIVQAGEAPFSGANNYAYLLNHDAPGILANRFEVGDYNDAQSLLLNARISEQTNFNELGANWYWDGPWRTPIAWAAYLEGTNDTAFVAKYFHDDASAPSQWGPSLFTLMHTDLESQLNSSGYLKRSNDNDSGGTWLFDDETALAGLQAYRYIASRIGNDDEAQWAAGAYTSLLNAVNAALATNEQANDFNFLPCEVNVPITADRCNTAGDANWDGSNLWGQNVWDIFLQGGQLNGILADPSQTDGLYETGFSRLQGTGVPFPSFGAYSGYSVALNTAYAQGALYGNAYRDLPITSYAWQIATTTGGPNAWWEANGSAPDPNNPWAGSHAAPQFGAVPYVWPMAGQTQTLLQSLVAPGLAAPGSHGSISHPVLYIGRGVPDAWITPGQTIAVNNLTTSYDEASGERDTYGVQVSTLSRRGQRTVEVSLDGKLPGSDIQVQLPVFAHAGVRRVKGGSYDPTTHTVSMGRKNVEIELGAANRPSLSVSVQSTAPGQHSQPALNPGVQTTASSSITNTGAIAITNVKLNVDAPTGWTSSATTPAAFNAIAPGQTKTVTWNITPPADMTAPTSANGVTVDASYNAPDAASGSVTAEQWVTVEKPLPLPPGSTDLALTATPSASYASPWTTVTGINSGLFPVQSNDDNDLTPYWGDWPMTGTHWIELDWSAPITTDSSELYFADDGGGLLAPSSWVVQYWNGSDWVNVGDQSGDPSQLNQFNDVTFDSVTTTKLRVSMQGTGTASVGVVQWVVPSIPS
ncbi:MAG TPA: NEW3 domain-containing protein [Solirubrobacteraceae bacterium]